MLAVRPGAPHGANDVSASSCRLRAPGTVMPRLVRPCRAAGSLQERAYAGFRSSDEELLDLACALVEGHDAGVAHVLLDRVLVHVAVSAEGLDGQVGGADRGLAGVELGLRR